MKDGPVDSPGHRVTVRRVRLHEWREVRELRIRAVSDPAASIAFLASLEDEIARDDAFWQSRTADAALGENAAQFIAEADGRWVGTATVLVRSAGERDTLGRVVPASQADLVGVFVDAANRGAGILGELVAAADAWARGAVGAVGLTLDVHAENLRAQAAYRKLGFEPTGLVLETVSGSEVQMIRAAG